MSTVFAKAATRCLASTSTSTSAPVQKKLLSTTSKCAMPLYFFSDHKPSTSTHHSQPYDTHNAQRIHSISGDLTHTQHAYDPPPPEKAGTGWSFDASAQRIYRPLMEEYDYMDGCANYGIASGVVNVSKSR